MQNSENYKDWNHWVWWSGKVDFDSLDMLNVEMMQLEQTLYNNGCQSCR